VNDFHCDGTPVSSSVACALAPYEPPLAPACRACLGGPCCDAWGELASRVSSDAARGALSVFLSCAAAITGNVIDLQPCSLEAEASLPASTAPYFRPFINCQFASTPAPFYGGSCYALCSVW
jgi:hypothetical protein